MTQTLISASSNHFDLLRAIQRRSKGYWGYSSDFMDRFMEAYGLTPSIIHPDYVKILVLDDSTIGFYAFTPAENDSLYLDSFFIDPPYIGQGFGRELWKHCVRTAKSLGAKSLTLWSDPNADTFYQKLGCREIGSQPSALMPDRYPKLFAYELT